jgi:hypothetical protein
MDCKDFSSLNNRAQDDAKPLILLYPKPAKLNFSGIQHTQSRRISGKAVQECIVVYQNAFALQHPATVLVD